MENEKKKKIESALEKRNAALKKIKDYQDKTGVPDELEADNQFLDEFGVKLDELKNENEEKDEV